MGNYMLITLDISKIEFIDTGNVGTFKRGNWFVWVILDYILHQNALYGSEIWGSLMCTKSIDKCLKKLEELQIERVYLSYAKHLLGVHKNTTTAAVPGELGLLPIGMDALKMCFKYRDHIVHSPVSSMLGAIKGEDCLKVDGMWWNVLDKMELLICNKQGTVPDLLNKLESMFKEKWRCITENEESKLRTYATFKTNIWYEQYLSDIHERSHRRAVTRLRTSSHGLRIETGRYNKPKLTIEQRTCLICSDGIEDELHFVTKCGTYGEERAKLYTNVAKECKNFHALNEKEKFHFLISAEGDIIRAFGKYCHTAFEIRKNIMYPLTA